MTLPAPFAALNPYRRFVTYDKETDADRPGKTIKRPTSVPNGFYCNSNLAEHQYSYDEAAATGRPVGFVIDRADGFWFLDIDNCVVDGDWSPLAKELFGQLAGAAVEISQSGRGLHLLGRGSVPPHALKNIGLGLELYTHQRFVALTFTAAAGDVSSDHSAAIATIAGQYFPLNPHGEIAGWSAEPIEEYGGPTDDEELLRAAMASGKKSVAAAFGTGNVTFADLWLADADKLAKRWPDGQGGYDASSADAALASHFAYWTGKDNERTRTLMLRSGLARQKWEERPEWLETTILKAASVVTNVLRARLPIPLVDAGDDIERTIVCTGSTQVSEDTVATAFSAKFGDTVRFDHSAGAWFRWQRNRWQRDETDQVSHHVRELSRQLGEGNRATGKASFVAGAGHAPARGPSRRYRPTSFGEIYCSGERRQVGGIRTLKNCAAGLSLCAFKQR
jgi:primase-polymerase (primpol)-like protein